MALIVTAPGRNTHVTGSFRAGDVPICGWKFHSCELIDSTGVKWCVRPSPVTTDCTHMCRVSSVHRKVQFFPGSVTVGYTDGLLTDWRQNCHFPTQSNRDNQRMIHCVTRERVSGSFHMNLISMQGGCATREVHEQARLIDNNGHWGKIQKAAEVNLIWKLFLEVSTYLAGFTCQLRLMMHLPDPE